ncbi:MAG: 30S ribosome-binding factor RbfA [Gemmataceae bacterium]
MKQHRLARVSEVIREVAATTILLEMRDPRVKMVTVTRAEVSGDLQHATVYVSVMGSEREQNLVMHGLKAAAGFVQSRLAQRMQTRFTPVIKFVLDKGLKNAQEVSRILREEAEAHAPGEPGGSPDEASAEGMANGDAHPETPQSHQGDFDGRNDD